MGMGMGMGVVIGGGVPLAVLTMASSLAEGVGFLSSPSSSKTAARHCSEDSYSAGISHSRCDLAERA